MDLGLRVHVVEAETLGVVSSSEPQLVSLSLPIPSVLPQPQLPSGPQDFALEDSWPRHTSGEATLVSCPHCTPLSQPGSHQPAP